MAAMIQLTEQQIIDQLAARLAATHEHIDPAHVGRVVLEEYARFDGRPIRDFIPLLVERNVNAELTKRAETHRTLQGTAP